MAPAWDAVDVRLDGWRLRLAGDACLVAAASAVMVPPCDRAEPGGGCDWELHARQDTGQDPPASAGPGTAFEDLPVLGYPCGGPRLAVLHAGDGLIRLLGRYQPGSGTPALLEADQQERRTRVVVPAGGGAARRWPEWLARTFFASRMLAGRWRMLHASAVAIQGRAVLFIAGRGGGKSTLAHRAVTELGAAFLGDDLAMIGPDATVAGWPTRAALPEALTTTRHLGTGRPLLEGTRRRVALTPAQHRAVMPYVPPAPLGLLVHITTGPGPALSAHPLDPAGLRAAADAALPPPAQRLYSADLLGLTGGPAQLRQNWPGSDWDTRLGGARGVRLTVNDLSLLPHAPVWQALAPWLTGSPR